MDSPVGGKKIRMVYMRSDAMTAYCIQVYQMMLLAVLKNIKKRGKDVAKYLRGKSPLELVFKKKDSK